MTAKKGTMTSFPEEFLAILNALNEEEKRRRAESEKMVHKNIQDKKETPEEEFERLIQTRDAIEY
jgi:hypothetical protein